MLCAPLQVLFWVAFLLHIALLLILYFELGLAARGMKTRGALLFARHPAVRQAAPQAAAAEAAPPKGRAPRPRGHRRRRNNPLVVPRVLRRWLVRAHLRLHGAAAAPPPPDALPGAAHVWLVAIDVAALLLKLLMPLQPSASTATAPPSPTSSTTTRWRAVRTAAPTAPPRRGTTGGSRRCPTSCRSCCGSGRAPIGSPIWKELPPRRQGRQRRGGGCAERPAGAARPPRRRRVPALRKELEHRPRAIN